MLQKASSRARALRSRSSRSWRGVVIALPPLQKRTAVQCFGRGLTKSDRMAHKVLVHSIQIHPTELQQPAPPKRGLLSFGSSLRFRVMAIAVGCTWLRLPAFAAIRSALRVRCGVDSRPGTNAARCLAPKACKALRATVSRPCRIRQLCKIDRSLVAVSRVGGEWAIKNADTPRVEREKSASISSVFRRSRARSCVYRSGWCSSSPPPNADLSASISSVFRRSRAPWLGSLRRFSHRHQMLR